jgi:transposase-like protein
VAKGNGGDPPRRWSAEKKAEAVMRLLRGEELDVVSREMKVSAARLSGWREEFMAGGVAGLKSRETSPAERELQRAKAKVGELTMKIEIIEGVLRKRGVQVP